MDPAQALTGADDAANTGDPDQLASNVTTRLGLAQTRPAPARQGLATVMAYPAASPAESRSSGHRSPENDVYGRRSLTFFHPRASRQ
jgi:hypothetical protein